MNIETIKMVPSLIGQFFRDHFGKMSAETLGWLGIILCHLASVPTLMAVLVGLTDKLPPVDLMLFVWASLLMMFFKALIERNILYIATICIGFAAQTVLMALIVFK